VGWVSPEIHKIIDALSFCCPISKKGSQRVRFIGGSDKKGGLGEKEGIERLPLTKQGFRWRKIYTTPDTL